MEHEVHSLKEIQDPLDLQGPDDPPHEGCTPSAMPALVLIVATGRVK